MRGITQQCFCAIHSFGTIGDEVQPVFQRLLVVPLEFFAALLHLQQKSRSPQQIGEARTLSLVDAVSERPAGFADAGMTECLHEPVAKDLRLVTVHGSGWCAPF